MILLNVKNSAGVENQTYLDLIRVKLERREEI